MPCPLCGDICRCSSPAYSDTYSAVSPDAEPETPAVDAPSQPPLAEDSVSSHRNESAPDDSPAWRQEVAARLSRYQSRRKPRPPRYPSLHLRFEEENHPTDERTDDRPAEDDSTRAAGDVLVGSSGFPHRVSTISNQALALDEFADSVADPPALGETGAGAGSSTASASQPANPTPTTAKIIEFPRSWTPPPSPIDELAEAGDRTVPAFWKRRKSSRRPRLWAELRLNLPSNPRPRNAPASTSRCRVRLWHAALSPPPSTE